MSRSLLQLKRSWEKGSQKNLLERPTAYFWIWLGQAFHRVLNKRGISAGNREDVQRILNRFKKVFNEDFAYLIDVYHLTNYKTVLWPKKDCFKFLGVFGDCWVANHDAKTLKDGGVIRWCNTRKIWAIESMFLNYLEKGSDGQIINKAVAYTVEEREQHVFNCSVCNLFWSINNKHDIDTAIVCPVCVVKEKAPNKPHTQNSIFQGYHCSTRNGWKYKVQREGTEKSMPMGVELEVDIREKFALEGQGKISWNIYKEQIEANKNWHNLIFERDGSLGLNGMEIISNPMTLEYGSPFWKKMIPVIAKYCTGWEVPVTTDYGIHITVSRNYLSDFTIARIHKFFTNPANTSFMVAIAQRGVIYGGKEIGRISQRLREHYTFKNKKLCIATNRYSLINAKDKLVEFRMFHSTLNLESFLKNLEFIDGLREWAVNGEFRFHYEDFIKWLVSSNENKKRYSNLLNFLSRKQFHVKKLKTPIINTWKPLLNGYKEQNIPTEETL